MSIGCGSSCQRPYCIHQAGQGSWAPNQIIESESHHLDQYWAHPLLHRTLPGHIHCLSDFMTLHPFHGAHGICDLIPIGSAGE